MLERVWRKGILLHCWWECKLLQPLWKTVWRFLKKPELEIAFDSAIPLPGIYPEDTIIEKDTYTPVFIAALFTITRSWMESRCILRDEQKRMCFIFSRQENWRKLSFSPPEDLPDSGIELMFLAFAGRFFTTDARGRAHSVLLRGDSNFSPVKRLCVCKLKDVSFQCMTKFKKKKVKKKKDYVLYGFQ